MIRAVLFDAEGVVLDTEALWDEAQRELLGRRGLNYDRAAIKPLLTGRSLLDGTRVLCDALGLADDPEALARERREIMERLLPGRIRFVDGFEAFHGRLRQLCATGLATAMDPPLFHAADRALDLRAHFGGVVVTVDDVGGAGKPAPDLFVEAARRLGVPPDTCLVIEDAPLGIEAARRAGMRVVGLATTHEPERLSAANRVCGSFAEVEQACEELGVPTAVDEPTGAATSE